MHAQTWFLFYFRFKFKALELNRKILEGALVPKKPPPKDATRPEGFQLEVEKRLQERHTTKKTTEQEDHTFHSRPLPTRILEEVVVSQDEQKWLDSKCTFQMGLRTSISGSLCLLWFVTSFFVFRVSRRRKYWTPLFLNLLHLRSKTACEWNAKPKR